MTTKAGFDALMDFVCVEWGYCGSIHRDGTPLHVTLFIPPRGPVTADQFVEWVFLAEGINPNVNPEKWQPHKDAIRAAFIEHMGGEVADAKALRWSDCDGNEGGESRQVSPFSHAGGGAKKVDPGSSPG